MIEHDDRISKIFQVKGSLLDFLAFIYFDKNGEKRAVGRVAFSTGELQYFEPRVGAMDNLEQALLDVANRLSDTYGYEMVCLEMREGFNSSDLLGCFISPKPRQLVPQGFCTEKGSLCPPAIKVRRAPPFMKTLPWPRP